jgi:hypothetical protein
MCIKLYLELNIQTAESVDLNDENPRTPLFEFTMKFQCYVN